MCGDFDDAERMDDDLFERFCAHAKQFGVKPHSGGNNAPKRLETDNDRAEYMKQLFAAGLSRCSNDAANLPRGERMDAIAGQAIVFARLAGFLTAQLPPEADLFRTVTAAVVDGHSCAGA